MIQQPNTDISSFFIAGINYKKTDASIRGQFSINAAQYQLVLADAVAAGITDLFVLSTCNRTEIYGFATDVDQLISLLCSHTEGSLVDFHEMAYCKQGVFAIEHLFSVAAGLDSQILGDYEIVGQIRQATRFSKQLLCMGPYLERLVNEVLQASKKIRTTTALSGGTVSVSFAAVQYAREHFINCEGKKILLIGTGKIGSNTCKNIVDYLPETQVTLVNRTEATAVELASKYNLQYDVIENLSKCVEAADLIIVATNADEPIITKAFLNQGSAKLIIDLSVPYNVAPDVKELEKIMLVNVDELSKIKDATLQKRLEEVPKVKIIIQEHINAFIEWHEMRKYVPVLKAVKTQLKKMHLSVTMDQYTMSHVAGMCEKTAEQKIQKVINGMAVKMRTHNQRGCQYIEAMYDFIATGSN